MISHNHRKALTVYCAPRLWDLLVIHLLRNFFYDLDTKHPTSGSQHHIVPAPGAWLAIIPTYPSWPTCRTHWNLCFSGKIRIHRICNTIEVSTPTIHGYQIPSSYLTSKLWPICLDKNPNTNHLFTSVVDNLHLAPYLASVSHIYTPTYPNFETWIHITSTQNLWKS